MAINKQRLTPEIKAWMRDRFQKATELERIWMVAGWSHGSGSLGESEEECKKSIQEAYGIEPPPLATKTVVTELRALILDALQRKGEKHEA